MYPSGTRIVESHQSDEKKDKVDKGIYFFPCLLNCMLILRSDSDN